jgi:transcription elongation factor SPT6
MQLRKRKQKMIQLYEQMQQYQFDQADPDKPLDSHIRTLTDDDVDRYDELCLLRLMLQAK